MAREHADSGIELNLDLSLSLAVGSGSSGSSSSSSSSSQLMLIPQVSPAIHPMVPVPVGLRLMVPVWASQVAPPPVVVHSGAVPSRRLHRGMAGSGAMPEASQQPIKLCQSCAAIQENTPTPLHLLQKLESEPLVCRLRRIAKEGKLPLVAAKGGGGVGGGGGQVNGRGGATGILWRVANRRHVRITCTCHGWSFSPVAFLRHAGCEETSQPLKRIVVIPTP